MNTFLVIFSKKTIAMKKNKHTLKGTVVLVIVQQLDLQLPV